MNSRSESTEASDASLRFCVRSLMDVFLSLKDMKLGCSCHVTDTVHLL